MKTREEFQRRKEDFANVIKNHIGEGKRYKDVDDLVFDLYQTTIDQDTEISKYRAFLDKINKLSSNFFSMKIEDFKK
jgi:hypothetical protein